MSALERAQSVARAYSDRVWIPGCEHDSSVPNAEAGGWLLCRCCYGFAPKPVWTDMALAHPEAEEAPSGCPWPDIEAISHDSDCPVGVMLEQAAETERLRATVARVEFARDALDGCRITLMRLEEDVRAALDAAPDAGEGGEDE